MIHCQAHKKAIDQESLGNNWTDRQAKEAAKLYLEAALLFHPFLPPLQYNSRVT
jgi:hypothetical protein